MCLRITGVFLYELQGEDVHIIMLDTANDLMDGLFKFPNRQLVPSFEKFRNPYSCPQSVSTSPFVTCRNGRQITRIS